MHRLDVGTVFTFQVGVSNATIGTTRVGTAVHLRASVRSDYQLALAHVLLLSAVMGFSIRPAKLVTLVSLGSAAAQIPASVSSVCLITSVAAYQQLVVMECLWQQPNNVTMATLRMEMAAQMPAYVRSASRPALEPARPRPVVMVFSIPVRKLANFNWLEATQVAQAHVCAIIVAPMVLVAAVQLLAVMESSIQLVSNVKMEMWQQVMVARQHALARLVCLTAQVTAYRRFVAMESLTQQVKAAILLSSELSAVPLHAFANSVYLMDWEAVSHPSVATACSTAQEEKLATMAI